MTTASASSATGSASGDAAGTPGAGDALAGLHLILDRELLGVRRHELELAGRVPESVRPHVDASAGMLEFLVDDGSGGVVVLALAPGARGDTVVPLLPAAQPTEPGGRDVSADEPFDEIVGEAVEDVSRLLTHVEHPDEMRGLVLHLGGRMLMVYADLWELRVTLLP
ncbi:hypothetical protein EV188_10763 [Actinomycetospora succinea]|uniref:Uncharacterized protein n=1 Tax=Actinomycetospora succinea TaxID=663603 RepID=A0A4R6V2I8_9PSEU|nr:hypothetical protein [Actinomycetospora succinea]TDQ52687.1 hypothetical protein EV188_10763 [Actinomycetospora succinea]